MAAVAQTRSGKSDDLKTYSAELDEVSKIFFLLSLLGVCGKCSVDHLVMQKSFK